MKKAQDKLKFILNKYKNIDIPVEKLDVFSKIYGNKKSRLNIKICSAVTTVIIAVLIVEFRSLFNTESCVLDMFLDSTKLFREPEYCSICENVDKVDKIANVSSDKFYELYIKYSRPVVVKDGALSWPAVKDFNFFFFKSLYESIDINDDEKKNCQFFPYKTEFKSLREVFNMSEDRANLKPGEKAWYIGWNNCNDDAGKILSNYYSKPYFLNNATENIAMSWIFMGGPGYGAHMHVDNVRYPSWQAQLNGRKKWKLAPPPECYYKCTEMEIVVEKGEIIVLDTNRWYHQTTVLPGDISITIGNEFD